MEQPRASEFSQSIGWTLISRSLNTGPAFARQAAAAVEGVNPNAGHAVRNGHARQAIALGESASPDAGHVVRNGHARQVAALVEGLVPNAGNGFTFDNRWYHHLHCIPIVWANDDYGITLDTVIDTVDLVLR